jgi:hypothetical protein
MDWPASGGGNRFAAVGTIPGTSAGTVITANATAHVMGAFVPFSLVTPISASGITLTINTPTTLVASYLINIGIGASGSEQIIIPNIIVSSGVLDLPAVVYFPVRIPAGVRLAAQVAASTASSTVTISGMLHGAVWGSPVPNQRVVAWRAGALVNSRGTAIDPGAVANTKPTTYTTVAAATTESARGLIIGLGNQIDLTRTVAHWLIDVAVGAAASERIIIPDYYARASVNETVMPVLSPVFPVSVPAGSRLSVRAQSNNITAGDRSFDVVLYSIV